MVTYAHNLLSPSESFARITGCGLTSTKIDDNKSADRKDMIGSRLSCNRALPPDVYDAKGVFTRNVPNELLLRYI